MPVRIVAPADPGDAPDWGPPADGTPPKRRGVKPMVAALVVLVVLVLVMGGYIASQAFKPAAAPTPAAATSAASPASSPSPATTSPSTPPASQTGGAGVPLGAARPVETAPGLWYGWATVDAGNSTALYGIKCGWPHTKEGAAAAAMNIDASILSLPFMVDSTRHQLTARLYTTDGAGDMISDAYAAGLRKKYRLNDDGVVVLADGRPSPSERYYGGSMPRYGAYRFVSVTENVVVVQVWMPTVAGPGTDDNLKEVLLSSGHNEYTLRWGPGPGGDDWRLAVSKPLPMKKMPAQRSNIGYPLLSELLGDGWLVPADATDKPYPGAVWAQ